MVSMQIGKSGLTPQFIEALRATFKRQDNVKISLLKSFSREREKVMETAETLVSSLNDKKFRYHYKIIGFTIILLRRKQKHGKDSIRH